MNSRVLVVEDDPALNSLLCGALGDGGYQAMGVGGLGEAREQVARRAPEAVLLDQQLPDGLGYDFLLELREREPDIPVIMVTGAHDLDLAIRAIQKGAFDFIHKPVRSDELLLVLAKAFEHRRLLRQVEATRLERPQPGDVGAMFGQSRAMLEVSKEIALVADSDARVLINGESGTGKELAARALHAHSGRDGPFMAVNCAAIVDTLLESELFGHEKGAFTGAVTRKAGKFELATDGTLFLDEVGELALPLQAKLLRVLQDGLFERVGGTQQLSTRARIVSATNRDLEAEVAAGRFREDLLYRLKVIQIRMPPLRDRLEDIPLLVKGLLQRVAAQLHKAPPTVTDEAMKLLGSYSWPGNVRELENALTQALVRARGSVLGAGVLHLPDPGKGFQGCAGDDFLGPDGSPLSLATLESRHVQRVLDFSAGHKGRCCRILGISRPALERKIQKYDLRVPDRNPADGNADES